MSLQNGLGFIGAGAMASAIIRGVLAAGVIEPSKIWASDGWDTALERLKDTGINTTKDNNEVVKNTDTIIIAVKPHIVAKVLSGNTVITEKKLIVSIAAGITIADMEKMLGKPIPVVRVMPNTPAQVGAVAAGVAGGAHATQEHTDLVETVFGAIGKAYTVPENLLDAVTGVSGSGPAYIYLVIEAMADGGVRAGLPRDIALGLAAQTVFGASKMVLETGEHPGVLKDKVCSPGGTTITAVHELENNGLRAAFINAVYAAATKAADLGKANSKL
eukprot:Clim_evm77s25 gene=Clim_evmTU77s25